MTDLKLDSGLITENNTRNKNRIFSFDDAGFKEVFFIYLHSFLQWRIWFHMGMSEIRRRYRRTLLGPFWASLSLAIFIGCMSLVFPRLWHTDIHSFLPFFASGFVIWTFISTLITEACGTFLDLGHFIKQMNLPYPIYAMGVVTRNFLTMLHHLLVYGVIMVLLQIPITLNLLYILPALALLSFTAVSVCIILGFITTRFRDVRQIVASLLQISIFVTPIFWRPVQLGSGHYAHLLVKMNPLYYLVEIARAPLIGEPVLLSTWMVAGSLAVLLWIIAMSVMRKYYKHLIFWL